MSRVHAPARVLLASVTAGLFSFFVFRFSLQAAQDPPAQEPQPFTTEVNYVRVDMYPTSGGKPVTDLQQADVEILEDGILQKIAQFEQVTVGSSRPQTTAREPSTMNEMRRAAQDPRARVIVLFLDPRFVAAEGAVRIRAPLIDALNKLVSGRRPDRGDDARYVGERPHIHETNRQHRADAVRALGNERVDRHERCAGGPVRSVLRQADHRRWTVDGARDDCPPPRDADAQRTRRAHPASAGSPRRAKGGHHGDRRLAALRARSQPGQTADRSRKRTASSPADRRRCRYRRLAAIRSRDTSHPAIPAPGR